MNLLQTATGITKCDDYYKLRQCNVYYADHGFLHSISRKRLTFFIFKVSGHHPPPPLYLGVVIAMAPNNILATAIHSNTKTVWRGNPSTKLTEMSSLTYQQTATTNEATSQKGTKTRGCPKKNTAQMTGQIMTIYLGTGKAIGAPGFNFFWRRQSIGGYAWERRPMSR